MKKSLFLLLLIMLWPVARFTHHQTAGFRMAKVTNNFAPFPSFTPLDTSFFDQKFTYFGRGLQSFAFVSEDGNYILKLFNNRLQSKLSFLRWVPFSQKKREALLTELDATYRSYEIAFKELPLETGLISLHLSPTSHLKKNITLVDKLGIEHRLSLDQTGFLVQKRATLAYPKLLEYKNQNDLEGAREALTNLLNLLLLKFEKGICDNDPLIRTNFGFIGNEAIQIDVGPFSKKEEPHWKEEMIRITTSLKIWIKDNYSELTPFIEQQLEEMLN